MKTYIPTLDKYMPGTVEYDTNENSPTWVVRLDEPYKHEHFLSVLHGIPSHTTNAHYLDGNTIVKEEK